MTAAHAAADPAASTAWATWILAVATIVLTVVAGVAAWYAAKVFRIESERDQQRDVLAQREQASKVSAWFGTGDIPAPLSGGMPQFNAPGAYVLNRAELPIYDVRLDVFYVNPGGSTQQGILIVSLVPPFTVEPTWCPMQLPAAIERAVNGREGELRVSVRFRGAQGREWSRSYDGQLSQIGSMSLAGAGTITAIGKSEPPKSE